MSKKSVIYAAVVAFVFSMVMAGVTIAAHHAGPAEMTLKTKKGKKPAAFPHKKHQEMMDCAECHHSKGADGKQQAYSKGMKIAKCETCHDGTMANKKVATYKNAAHVNCKGCHKAKKKGPTGCTKGCHVKKK